MNVIAVTADGRHAWQPPSLARSFERRRSPAGFDAGYVVVRPEFVRFVASAVGGGQRLEGLLYNEYVLGSRVQYQVRVGEQVFIVEKLRQQAFAGKRDDEAC